MIRPSVSSNSLTLHANFYTSFKAFYGCEKIKAYSCIEVPWGFTKNISKNISGKRPFSPSIKCSKESGFFTKMQSEKIVDAEVGKKKNTI